MIMDRKKILFLFNILIFCVLSSAQNISVEFSYFAPDADSVKVAMDLYNWDENKMILEKDDNGLFYIRKYLPIGKYRYKYIVDGKWKLKDDEPAITEKGFTNHIIKVGNDDRIRIAQQRKEKRLERKRSIAKKYGNLSTEMYRLYDSFSFAVFGNMKNDRGTIRAAVDFINSKKVAFTIGVGNYVEYPSDIEQWIDFLSVLSSLKEPFVPAVGEQEYKGDEDASYIKQLMRLKDSKTYFSYVYQDKKFIFTDTEQERHGSYFSRHQTEWLEDELKDTSVKGKVVVGYRPYFIRGSMPGYKDSWSKYSYERDRLHSLYRKNDVLSVFSGCEDTFVYKKVDDIDYFVCPSEHIIIVDMKQDVNLYRVFYYDSENNDFILKETIRREVE